MPIIPVSRTKLLIEVAPDIEPAEVVGEERWVAGSLYRIAPCGSVKARAAQGPAAPVWLMATPEQVGGLALFIPRPMAWTCMSCSRLPCIHSARETGARECL
jgi:hypothetical protein